MRSLKEIDNDISQQRNELKTKLEALLKERQEYFNSVFEDSKALQKAIIDSSNSSLYQWEQNGEWIESWFRVDLTKFQDCLDELETYLEENHGIRLDRQNDCFLNSLGPSIIINEEGDVLDQDSGKWIISRKNYSDKKDRNAQIEAWMEKQGYFPVVFESDRYGNLTPINTKGE